MAVTQSSKQRQQWPPPQPPPAPPAYYASMGLVSAVSGILTATLVPTMSFKAIKAVLKPIFELYEARIGDQALQLALQEVERYSVPVHEGLGFAQQEVIELNRARWAGYIVKATERTAAKLAEGKPIEDIRKDEDRYLNQTAQAQAKRVLAGSSIDSLASQYGPVLGWYAVEDSRTTAECREADGKNFRVDSPPDIGYPGIVHMNCRCRPGVPHPNAAMLPSSGTSTLAAANAHRARILELVRSVRTAAGVARFHEPIGTPITAEMEEAAETAKKAHRNAVRRTGATKVARGSRNNAVVREDDARKAQGQTRSNFMHPFTDQPMTKTEIGDTYEELFERHGAALLAKKFPGMYQPISGKEGGARNTPLDFKLDTTFGGELKTLSATSQNQKTAIKREEIDRKLEALKGMKLKPLLVVQVVDQSTGTVEVYAFPNFVSKAVKQMEYVGSYSYTKQQFKEAQMARRQWKGTTELANVVRHVRTERGVALFKKPIGSPITEAEYQAKRVELLGERQSRRVQHPVGHPSRLEAERNVRSFRKEFSGDEPEEAEEAPREAPKHEEVLRNDEALQHVDRVSHPDLVPKEHHGTLDYYNSMNGYRHINNRARGVEPPQLIFGKDQPLESIKHLDKAFEHAKPLEHDIEVHRGITNTAHATGDRFTEKGFMSTTTSGDKAVDYATGMLNHATAPGILHLRIPAGMRAISTEPFKTGGESAFGTVPRLMKEVLLPRGTTVRVHHTTEDTSGVRHLYGTVESQIPGDLGA